MVHIKDAVEPKSGKALYESRAFFRCGGLTATHPGEEPLMLYLERSQMVMTRSDSATQKYEIEH